MNFRKLSIFTTYGGTYSFKDVEEFNQNETVITFRFKAQSDGESKKATFFVSNVAGFTVLE
jgi:hypothetical protein